MTLHELNKAMAEVEEIASETARLDEEQRLREYEVTIIEIARIAYIVIPDKLCDIMDIDWPELLKEARECQGDGGHHTGACIIPKYADYKIFGNVIILGQGADTEESHKNINLIVDGLKGVITE